jgi:hypothetical protein
MRKAPAYKIIPLNVAHPVSETSQNAHKPPANRISPTKAAPRIESRLYLRTMEGDNYVQNSQQLKLKKKSTSDWKEIISCRTASNSNFKKIDL